MTRDRQLDGLVRTHAHVGDRAEDGVARYAHGDDLRLIHGPQTRRRGMLMLRRRVVADESPAIILLDTAAPKYDDATFEEAVSAAASLVCATATGDRPVEVHATTHGLLHRGVGAAAIVPALDALAMVERDANRRRPVPLPASARGAGAIVLVTGVLDRDGLAATIGLARRASLVGVLAIGDASPVPAVVPGVAVAADATTAAHEWNRLVP